jgi:chromosome segregation ATPase
MNAPTPDIRFACGRCGQRIVVDASAAGVETECPGCREPVVIPGGAVLRDRESVTAAAGRAAAMESELAAGRKEISRLQEQLRVTAEERAAFQAALAESAKTLKQNAEDQEVARERIEALEAAAAAALATRAGMEKELAASRADVTRLEEERERQRRLGEDLNARLAAAEGVAQRVAPLEAEVRDAQSKLAGALEEGRRAAEQCERLKAAVETARRELLQTESGRELAALRARFSQTEEEDRQLKAQLAEVLDEAQRVARTERELRAQFDTMRRERNEALSRAEAVAPSALQHGNDVLRGIVDRQKAELDERYSELRRLRTAQLSLRILYALIGLAFMAAIALGLLALHGAWR